MRTLIFNPATGESRWEEDPPKRVDLVAVVRCKDCEWWRTGGATFIHEPFCELTSTRCDEDHYCGWAERKEDEKLV